MVESLPFTLVSHAAQKSSKNRKLEGIREILQKTKNAEIRFSCLPIDFETRGLDALNSQRLLAMNLLRSVEFSLVHNRESISRLPAGI